MLLCHGGLTLFGRTQIFKSKINFTKKKKKSKLLIYKQITLFIKKRKIIFKTIQIINKNIKKKNLQFKKRKII